MDTVAAIEFPERDKVVFLREPLGDAPLGPTQALIRSETSIISSGTELARLKGIEPGAGFPARPGYGTIGRIEAMGSALTGFNVGQRVFFAGKHASRQRFNHGEDHQWAYLFPVPEALDPVDAALGCMAQIAMTGPQITELEIGDTVAVFGLGLVGILAAQLYKLRGARVIGVDPVPARCALARKMGITETIDVAPAEQVAAVKAATGGAGAMVTVDAAGHTAVVKTCVEATAVLGQVVLLGSPRTGVQGDLTAALTWPIHLNGLTMRGAHMWRYPVRTQRGLKRSVEQNFAAVFALIADGRLKVRELVSHVIKPEQAPDAYAGLAQRPSEYTGVVIDWR